MLSSTRIQKGTAKSARRSKKPLLQPKKMPRQARSKATYESLLESTARLLSRRGYAALTTNHVAEQAGVAIGSLYEYFGTKEVLVAEVVRATVRDIAEDIAKSFQTALKRGLDQGMPGLIRAMIEAVHARKELVRAIWTEVPFLWDLEEVSALPGLMYTIARQGIPGATSDWLVRDPEAATYLLTVMVGAAVVESVVARPAHLNLDQLEMTLVGLLEKLLAPESACAKPAVSSGRSRVSER
jgi:AcrR family transcriptional regulator